MQCRCTPLQVKVWNSKCTQVKVQKYCHQNVLNPLKAAAKRAIRKIIFLHFLCPLGDNNMNQVFFSTPTQ